MEEKETAAETEKKKGEPAEDSRAHSRRDSKEDYSSRQRHKKGTKNETGKCIRKLSGEAAELKKGKQGRRAGQAVGGQLDR